MVRLTAFVWLMAVAAAHAASFHTRPRSYADVSQLGGEEKWLAALPAPETMILSDEVITCVYGHGLSMSIDRPSNKCVLEADGGKLSTNRIGEAICTYQGDPMQRSAQHCYVACP